MNRRYPRYPDDADYQTNAPSYYEDLARKHKLIEMLAKKIWEYEETLDLTLEQITNRLESYIEENDKLMSDRLEQWDLNLEKFPENVELLLQEWLSDGTLDHIINETIFNWKADKTYVDSEIERLDLKDEDLTTKLMNTERVVNVMSFGALGDGVTDDSLAFNKAKQYALLNDGVLFVPDNKTFKISGDLDLFGLRYIQSKGKILGNGTNTISVGYNSQSNYPSDYEFYHTENIKLQLSGLKTANIKILWADDVEIMADSDVSSKSSFGYNTLHLGRVQKLSFNGIGKGWINENKFFGGRITNLLMSGSYRHNHNHFYNPTFEGGNINIQSGDFNYFHNYRGEFGIEVTLGETTVGNVFIRSWYSSSIAYLRGTQSRVPITNWHDKGRENHNLSFNDFFYQREIIYELNAHSDNIDYDIFFRRHVNETTERVERSGNALTPFYTTLITPLKEPIGFHISAIANVFRFRLWMYDESNNLIKTPMPNFTSIVDGVFNEEGYYEINGNIKEVRLALVPNRGVAKYRLELLTDSSESNHFEWLKVEMIYASNKSFERPKTADKYKWNRSSTGIVEGTGRYDVGHIIYSKDPISTECIGWVNTSSTTSGGSWKKFGAILE